MVDALIAEEDIMSEAEQLLARTPDAEALQRTLSKIGELDLKDNLIELAGSTPKAAWL